MVTVLLEYFIDCSIKVSRSLATIIVLGSCLGREAVPPQIITVMM